ncbi:hypothetical protein C482_01941 [Natrialba chahannaoensis JCM 10990]|uniref:Uncharacterized protein n=1 Tax=Natrialba chahannaoensis JCM 10990 TaxID=1227492 RepID=M0B7M2_9EURY|nr:hypothetical protein [Natrialba chahannaoensis]ELZ05634.1 hypothetical protein C482_01941 [Natrialba chahannaoensis JCM 10990]
MGYSEDFVNAVRRSFIPQVHYLLQGSFDGYAVSHTSADEYALTAHCSEETIEEILDSLGFSRNPIAALKVRADGNTSEGSWVWRPSLLSSYQVHVVLHELENEAGVDVYAHWECSWIRHPYKHYVTRGYDAEKGVTLTRRWLTNYEGEELEGHGIEFEIDDSPARQASEYFSLSYYQLEEAVAGVRSWLSLLGAGSDDSDDSDNGDGGSGSDDDGNDHESLTIDRDGERDGVSPRIVDR